MAKKQTPPAAAVGYKLCTWDSDGMIDGVMDLSETEFQAVKDFIKELRAPKSAAVPETTVGGLLADLDKTEIEYLNTFVKILRAHTGFTTPAEEFILNLLLRYEMGGLTPEGARYCLENKHEGFEKNWEEAIENARVIASQYPKEFKADPDKEAA